jgi:hypothetical protein
MAAKFISGLLFGGKRHPVTVLSFVAVLGAVAMAANYVPAPPRGRDHFHADNVQCAIKRAA